jgi:hypothetical protein
MDGQRTDEIAEHHQPHAQGQAAGAPVFRVYPLSSVLLYNGVTLAHFGLGMAGLVVGYRTWPTVAWILGGAYMLFALTQMYVLMPLKVCPACAYRRMDGARCVSALNLVSARLAAPRDLNRFPERARGVLCHNNLYMAALGLPLLLMLPGMVADFSIPLLALFLMLVALLAFRLFVLFTRMACLHCVAKRHCPNAQAMRIS